jgi:HEAT repeat protein
VRQHALSVLGKTGRPETVPLLSRVALAPGSERQLRSAALGALGRLAARGHASARQALRQALRTLPWEARLQALAALGRSDSAEARAELAAALGDPDGFIREAAIRGLGELGPAGQRVLVERARPDRLPEVRRALREVLGPVARGGSPLAPRARQVLDQLPRDP